MTGRAYRHFETTAPVVTRCGRCLGPVIYGLAEGIPARVDVAPLPGPAAEAAVLDGGRQTYTLRRSGLVHRDPARRTDPALATPVLAEHACPGGRS